MRIIFIISCISLFSISAFWYLEVANDYQRGYVKDKASNAGQMIKEKSQEVYENRETYINKAKEIGQKVKDIGEVAIEQGKATLQKYSGNKIEEAPKEEELGD